MSWLGKTLHTLCPIKRLRNTCLYGRTHFHPGVPVIAGGKKKGAKARIAAISIVNNGGATIGLLAPLPGDFDQLGGVGLVNDVLASILRKQV